ncbi:MAG TPA: hypothetical protein DCY02_07300, partial [Armatimonadetes bacterium]|nr:hypothetical protein [Armatimonadota bacterium]
IATIEAAETATEATVPWSAIASARIGPRESRRPEPPKHPRYPTHSPSEAAEIRTTTSTLASVLDGSPNS